MEHLQCSVVTAKSVPKQFDLLVSNHSCLTVAGCYRPPSAPLCVLTALSGLLVPYTRSEFVLLGDLNWDMLKPSEKVYCNMTPSISLKLFPPPQDMTPSSQKKQLSLMLFLQTHPRCTNLECSVITSVAIVLQLVSV